MKYTSLVLSAVLMVACTQTPKNEEGTKQDTVSAPSASSIPDSSVVTQETPETVEASEGPAEPGNGSFSFRAFLKDPLGYRDYASIKGGLTADGVIVSDTTPEGSDTILEFEDSRIEVEVNENYGDLICSARIATKKFPLNQGVEIGMSTPEFLELTGLPESSLEPGGPGKFRYEFRWDVEEGYWQTVFYFENNALVTLEYNISPCVISD